MSKPRHPSAFHSAVTLALVAGLSLCAHAATTISGDYTIDHALSTDERPLVITADATITVAAEVATSLGIVTNNGHAVTINLESGSKAGLAWLTVRGNGTTTINFNGGALTDGGGWDTPWFDTASGSTVALVSVDGNPIRVTHPTSQRKYWNRNRDGGTPGRVTTSGSGRCDLLTASLSGTTKLALMLCGCSASDWGHTGGTYLGHVGEAGLTGYVWCNEANVLPSGDIFLGTQNGLSPVELNLSGNSQTVGRIHLQNAWSTVIAGAGTPALKFASANACIDSTSAAAAPVLSVPAITVEPGATLTVDKVAVSATALSNNGTLAYANGGKLTLNLSNASDAIAISASAPASGATAIVKSGAGTYSYAGDAALDIDALTVNAGEFRLSGPRGTTNRWWRFTIKQCESTTTHANISEMRLLDGILTAEGKYQPADGAAPDPDYPSANRYSFSRNTADPSTFAAYNYNFTYQQGAGTPTYTADQTAHGSGKALSPTVIWMNTATIYGCEFTNPHPKSADPNTWIAYTYRIADGRAIRGYNLRHAWYFSNYPKYWLLESSADGVTWETMDSQSNYALTSTGQSWYNNGGQGDLPNSMIDFGSQVKPTLPTAGGLASDANIKVAGGATFDASLVTGGQEISALTVDYAGGGTLKGVRFAATGTLQLQNVPVGTNLNEFAIPLAFENVVGTPSLANWTAVIYFANGTVREKKIAWDNGRIVIRSSPFVFVVR
ncbi:MAG: hypothetical protein IJK04_01750 [Kiritimatiellae bacterium]|nr:hypothetical protein [Kiritimatiellia bacterium]